MAEILIGVISGIVSGTGMRWWNNINIFANNNVRHRSAHSTSNKSNIFYTNINSCNNSKFKKQKHRPKISNININFWNFRSNNRGKYFNSYRCKNSKKMFWNIFSNNSDK